MIKPITFANERQQLVGILHVPDGLERGKKAPGIVMFHGFTGNKTEDHRLFVHVARALCGSGFVVLRFDFRGSGDSDGEFENMTIPGEVNDAKKALTLMAQQEVVDKERIGVIGLSMGGRVAAIVTSQDKRVRYVVLYSAALSGLKERFHTMIGEEAVERLDSGEAVKIGNGWYVKKPFIETIDDPVPLEVMDRVEVPVLIVQSDADQVVPLDDAMKGYEIVKDLNSKNELYVVKGGDHTFSEKRHKQEVIQKTLEWLDSLSLLS